MMKKSNKRSKLPQARKAVKKIRIKKALASLITKTLLIYLKKTQRRQSMTRKRDF